MTYNMYNKLKFRATGLGLVVCFAAVSLVGCQNSGSQQGGDQARDADHPNAVVPAAAGVAKVVATPVANRPGTVGAAFSTCNIEMVNDVALQGESVKVQRHAPLAVKGWVDAAALKEATLSLRFEGQEGSSGLYEVVFKPSQSRPDVAKALGQASSISGFETVIDGGSIPAGQYHVYLAASAGDNIQLCDNGRHLTLQD